MTMPLWALALNYWLHLLATITWLGGLAVLAILIWPGLTAEQQPMIEAFERRFRPYVNGSLALLLVTGFLQMSADSNYGGFLVFDNLWSAAMLVKHVLFGGMVALSMFTQLQTLPNMDRAHMLKDEAALAVGRTQLRRIGMINLGLGVLILLMTAIMTAV